MQINVTFDSSVSQAPAGFVAAVDYVVALFDATFTNNVAVNLDVGWGEVDGQSLGNGALGESITSGTNGYSFAQVQSALDALAASGDVVPLKGLPASDPTGGATIDPGIADARALGLFAASSSDVDGWIGLGGSFPFDFNPTQPMSAGAYDGIAVIEHELTEVMGRVAGLASPFSAQDLYRYESQGVLDVTGSGSDYVSVDHGATSLAAFNTDPNGDPGDWADSAGADAFLAFSSFGVRNPLSNVDLLEMAALGWNDTPIPAIHAAAAAPQSAGGGAQAVAFALDFNTDVTVTGAPTLTLGNGGTAAYVGGSGGHALIFDYTPPAGVTASSLTLSSVNLNGGSIDNATGEAANLSVAGLAVGQYGGIVASGPAGGDALTGAGDNLFLVSGGGNSVTGHSGVNTAALTGLLAQYTVQQSGDTITVTDGLPGRDGVNTLNHVQQVEFSDLTLVFDLHSPQDLLVYELYQAAFARIPDNPGFRYWADVADATGASAVSLASTFASSAEFSLKYGADPSNLQLVTELYANVLGRAPDTPGLDYLVNQANDGMSHAQLLAAFAVSAENATLIAPHIADGYWTT